MKKPASVAAWLEEHEAACPDSPGKAFTAVTGPSKIAVAGGPVDILGTGPAYVDAGPRDSRTVPRYRADPECPAPALSAELPSGETALLFHDEASAVEYAGYTKARADLSKWCWFYADRASSLMIDAAMACLRGNVPKGTMLAILETARGKNVPRAPGQAFGALVNGLPDDIFMPGERDAVLSAWSDGRLKDLKALADRIYFREADMPMDKFDPARHAACDILCRRVEDEFRACESVAYTAIAKATGDPVPRTAVMACRALANLENHDHAAALKRARKLAEGPAKTSSPAAAELAAEAVAALSHLFKTSETEESTCTSS